MQVKSKFFQISSSWVKFSLCTLKLPLPSLRARVILILIQNSRRAWKKTVFENPGDLKDAWAAKWLKEWGWGGIQLQLQYLQNRHRDSSHVDTWTGPATNNQVDTVAQTFKDAVNDGQFPYASCWQNLWESWTLWWGSSLTQTEHLWWASSGRQNLCLRHVRWYKTNKRKYSRTS